MQTLVEYLTQLEQRSWNITKNSLDNLKQIANQLNLLPVAKNTIVVAGTNGKGSTVATLNAIYQAAGYQVAAYTSPHIHRYNERLCFNGCEVSDEDLLEAFAVLEAASPQALSYFEMTTLACLYLIKQAEVDVALLEIGLGGRLDAVNIVDADLSIITGIALDHCAYLGDTRELIGFEKAGIMRAHKPCVCGDDNPPKSIIEQAAQLATPLYLINKDFAKNLDYMPKTGLHPNNIASALQAISLLLDKLPVSKPQIQQGLSNIKIQGRCQIIPGEITYVYDVAHNPQAVAALAAQLPKQTRIHAVLGMLADKAIQASLTEIYPLISHWYVGDLSQATKRGATAEQLSTVLQELGDTSYANYKSIAAAYAAAKQQAQAGDWVVCFGSFHAIPLTS